MSALHVNRQFVKWSFIFHLNETTGLFPYNTNEGPVLMSFTHRKSERVQTTAE